MNARQFHIWVLKGLPFQFVFQLGSASGCLFFFYDSKSESKKNHAVINNKLQFGIYKTGKL